MAVSRALFLAASGYHHRLGTNTWAGSDAKPPAGGRGPVLEWSVELPDAARAEAAAQSLTRAGYAAERDGAALVTRDPWGMPLRL
ncbi:MAG TPA: hypothetical protein VIV56_09385, partial [Gemmatimonadales bacterium]